MQLSRLSRNTLYISGPCSRRHGMGDDERRIDLAFFDAAEQIVGPAIDMRLAHAEGQALVHGDAHRNLVDEPAVNAGNGNHAGRPADIDHLAQHMRPVGLQHHHLLGAVVERVRLRQRNVRFKADRIDALFRPLATGQLIEPVDDAVFLEIDRGRATRFSHG